MPTGRSQRDRLAHSTSTHLAGSSQRIYNPGVKHMITAVCQKSEHTILRSLDGARPILLLDLQFVLPSGCLHSGFSILNSGFYCIVSAKLHCQNYTIVILMGLAFGCTHNSFTATRYE